MSNAKLFCGVLLLMLVAIPSKTQDESLVMFNPYGQLLCRGWNIRSPIEKTNYVIGYANGVDISTLMTSAGYEQYVAYSNSLWPYKLNGKEVVGRVNTYCAIHEPI